MTQTARPQLWDKLLNCQRCGRVFLRFAGGHCRHCASVLQEVKHRLYQYAQDHPQVPLEEMAQALGINSVEAEGLLMEGGFGTTASAILVPCARCGSPTPHTQRRGKLCALCAHPVESAIQQVIVERTETKRIEAARAAITRRHELPQQQQRVVGKKRADRLRMITVEASQTIDVPPANWELLEDENPQQRKRHGFKRNI